MPSWRSSSGTIDPIGHQAEAWGEKRTIVGVVSDIKDSPADSAAVPAFWFPHAQIPVAEMALVVRTDGRSVSDDGGRAAAGAVV